MKFSPNSMYPHNVWYTLMCHIHFLSFLKNGCCATLMDHNP